MNLVQGLVTTFTDVGVPQAEAAMSKIMPDQSLEDEDMEAPSDATGHFTLGFGTTVYDRIIKLSRKGKKLEGISTLDVITLQRHINGEEPITEAYKLYAADLDGNGRVGANDLVLLKKALLGGFKVPGYKGNLSWVFFGDPCAPDAPQDLFNNACHDGVEVDHTGVFPTLVTFKALKMGDVNGDMVNMAWTLLPRTVTSLPLYIRENPTDHSVDVLLSQNTDVYGFQLSINATDIGIIGGALSVDASSMAEDKDGYTNISWGQPNAVSVKADEVLFTITDVPEGISLEQLISNEEDALYPEIYTDQLKNQKIDFVPYHQTVPGNTFETRISPNPFSDVTKLQITIPTGEEFYVRLFDIKGQELFNRKYISYTPDAEVVIDSDMIKAPGVYYYRVKSSMGELSGKFIRQ